MSTADSPIRTTASATADGPIRKKWGPALDGGFVVTPAVLIKHQGALRISAEELAVLLNLFLSWRDADDKPYPRTATIAKRMNIADRTVQRRIASLESKGLIRREWGHPMPDGKRTPTRYDLGGIVGKLKQLGAEAKVLEPVSEGKTVALDDALAAAFDGG